MTAALVFEELDLPTRRTQKPELGHRDIRIVQHQRVQLMHPQALPCRLRDHETAVIAQAAPTAFAVEEFDQSQPLTMVAVSLVRSRRMRVLGLLASCISTSSRGRQALGGAHPWMM